ncbi:MAG: flagellar motor switch protein FliM [Cyanobacteria bacterium P01_H01_bin.74]
MLSQDEIDNLLSSIGGNAAPEKEKKPVASKSLVDEEPPQPVSISNITNRNYKLYNFKRPDKFSKDHLRALQSIYENFSRQFAIQMTNYLRMQTEIDIVSVDQLTYDEFVRSMPNPMTVGILEMDPLPSKALIGFSHEVTSSIIDRMLGGPGLSEQYPRELTDIEQSLIRRVIDRSVSAMEEAWRSVMTLTISLLSMEESYTMLQIVTPGEIVALITFEVNIGNGKSSGLISLCIPYPVLEVVITQLSAQNLFHGQNKSEPQAEDQARVLSKLQYAKTPVQVLLAGTSLSIMDMVNLRVGDVLLLDRKATDNLLTCVNGVPKFFCRPGKLGKNLAVYIYDPVERVEALEGFGLE